MKDQLLKAELLSPTGVRTWYPQSWFDYTYRYSKLKGQRPPKGFSKREM